MKNNAKHWQHALAVTGTVCWLMVPATATPARAEEPSGCHAVDVEAHITGVFPHFAGTISGDLQGSVDVVLDGFAATGHISHIPGEETWVITGGTIPELVGRTITNVFTVVQVFAPGQGSTPLINGTSRNIDGAERVNLTFYGTFDNSVFPFAVDVDYRGVVCP
jgi:hypothetical protein